MRNLSLSIKLLLIVGGCHIALIAVRELAVKDPSCTRQRCNWGEANGLVGKCLLERQFVYRQRCNWGWVQLLFTTSHSDFPALKSAEYSFLLGELRDLSKYSACTKAALYPWPSSLCSSESSKHSVAAPPIFVGLFMRGLSWTDEPAIYNNININMIFMFIKGQSSWEAFLGGRRDSLICLHNLYVYSTPWNW